MDTVKEVFTDILKPKSSLFSKCLGVLLATFFYYFAGFLIMPFACCRKNSDARKQGIAMLNSVVLAAAYGYSWYAECNPHAAEALDNSPTNEIPLMLTAGYYILDLSCRSFIDFLHHIISISAIIAVLVEGRAANVAVTFAFLVEVANLMYNIRKIAITFKSPCVLLLTMLYPAVFISVRVVALLHFSYNIVNNKDLPEIPQTLASVLFMMSFFYCFRMFQHIFCPTEEPAPTTKRRSRSRTPRVCRSSKARSRSRTSRCKDM